MVQPVIANGVLMEMTKPGGGTVLRAFDKPVQLHGVTASVSNVKIPLVLTQNPLTGSPMTVGGYTATCSAQSRTPFMGAKAIGIGGILLCSDGYSCIIPPECGVLWLNIT